MFKRAGDTKHEISLLGSLLYLGVNGERWGLGAWQSPQGQKHTLLSGHQENEVLHFMPIV